MHGDHCITEPLRSGGRTFDGPNRVKFDDFYEAIRCHEVEAEQPEPKPEPVPKPEPIPEPEPMPQPKRKKLARKKPPPHLLDLLDGRYK